MAVEARRLPLSSPQHLFNRELMVNAAVERTGGFCVNQTTYSVAPPLTSAATPLHLYGSGDTAALPTTADPFTPHLIKSFDVSSFAYCDGIDNNNNGSSTINRGFVPSPSRKRSRDSMANYPILHHQNSRLCAPSSFLGQYMSQIHQQQLEIDRLIALHMERVKMEMEEKRNRQVRAIMEAIEERVMKRLRAKEEEKEKIGTLNMALEERFKSLAVENQLWRDLAHTNQATAQALRTNLDLVLAQAKDLRIPTGAPQDLAYPDDAQSCCGDSEWRALPGDAQDKGRMCRSCGEEESCVLLLPCRHLCLCGACGANLHTCPICRSPKNATVHVNMSS
ncbi:PREDICTED: probable BOI-related E3 ubiquitin-protein ligase 2 [Tarenaya hassleriana]|uniref:probable BOI-related E3 ubiquitin-protein ligase 2 n=1 Tax=Tarenaya hassleriana TaxID=28532 RepID=UPI00053CA8EF|nr:PREDICTED: probable BOI-related E3 ubiquitin-protein ligase 2 [Tarenaya hassleriana]